MSEPAAGTDVLGMKTTAKEEPDGSFLLNGTKMWITNGAISDTEQGDVFLVYARTGEGTGGVSLFLLEKGTPGFSVGQRIKDKCGMRASGTAELVFENVRVPAHNLVGQKGGAVTCMMRNLEIERLALAAMSTGIARRCVEVMNRYGQDREAFGHSINHFGQVQDHIATSYAEYMAAKCYVYNTANMLELDATGSYRVDSDGVKLVCSKMATTVANRAMQVLGGYGYVGEYQVERPTSLRFSPILRLSSSLASALLSSRHASDLLLYQVERLWRDAKLIEIGGGTLEAHQKNMTRDLSRLETL